MTELITTLLDALRSVSILCVAIDNAELILAHAHFEQAPRQDLNSPVKACSHSSISVLFCALLLWWRLCSRTASKILQMTWSGCDKVLT
jgi:hypothetical protein